jgi:lysophospholipid acyltransferase (LPLAT)-like uncharacterized protein
LQSPIGNDRLTSTERYQAASIAALVSPLVAILCKTLTWRVEGLEHYDEVLRSGRQPIMSFWHGRILPAMYYFRDRGIVVMTSQNFDGEWIARVIQRYGFGAARGSTSRGGARALVQLRRDLEAGRPAGFTLDGPRGPARVAQPGAVWLAGLTGHPLLPFHVEAARHWSLASWDRTQIPKPFTTVAIVMGKPMYVGRTDPEGVEDMRAELQTSLSALERRAQALLAGGQ